MGQKRRMSALSKRRATPPSELTTVWFLIRKLAATLMHYICYFRYLNPVFLIREKHRRIYYTDDNGNTPIYPRFQERMINLFLSENRRRKIMLKWVQQKTKQENVTNFTSCWHDGIILCTILESLQPGVCPGYRHLKYHNRVNNCRLGIRLATQSLGLPQDMIMPEEMAIADKATEPKILKYVSMIKWAADNRRIKQDSSDEVLRCSRTTLCVSRGSGLEAGVISRKMRFAVHVFDVIGMFQLSIDIKGPNNEVYSETIISLHQASDLVKDDSPWKVIKEQNQNPYVDDRVMEFMEDGYGNSYVRWKNIKHFGDNAIYDAIAFQCWCSGKSSFLMSYLPVSAGIHTISIRWQNKHIEGSPFKVKIYQLHDTPRRSVKDSSEKRRLFGSLSLSSIEEKENMSFDEDFSASAKSGTSKISKRNRLSARFRKEYTVTKRRVKRKVVSRNGEEIVIYESPSPSLSQQSSMTDTSTDDSPSDVGSRYHKDTIDDSPSDVGSKYQKESMDDSSTKTEELSLESKPNHSIVSSNQVPNVGVESGLHSNNSFPQFRSIVEKIGTFTPISHHRKEDFSTKTAENKDAKVKNETQLEGKDQTKSQIFKTNSTLHRSVSDSSLSNSIRRMFLARKISDLKNKGFERIQDGDNIQQHRKRKVDSPSFKVLQSESLRKSCFYNNDKAFIQTISNSSSTSSTTSNSSVDPQKAPLTETRSMPTLDNVYDSGEYGLNHMKKFMRMNTFRSSRLRALHDKKSFQNEAFTDNDEVRDATSFSQDQQKEDCKEIRNCQLSSKDDISVSSNTSRMADNGSQSLKWKDDRALQSSHDFEFSDNCPKLKPGNRMCRRRESMLNWIENQQTSVLDRSDSLSENTAEERGSNKQSISTNSIDSNEIFSSESEDKSVESPKIFNPELGIIKRKTSTTGTLNRVHFDESKFSTKTIECSFSSLDACDHISRKGGLQRQMSIHSPVRKNEFFEGFIQPMNTSFRSISTDSSDNVNTMTYGHQVINPTAKMDKFSQVYASDIIQETKYLSKLFGLNITRRKVCIKACKNCNDESKTDDSTLIHPDENKDIKRPRSFSTGALYEQFIDYDKGCEEECLATLNKNLCINCPQRQSTMDTIDSGISDEWSLRTNRGQHALSLDGYQRNMHRKLFRRRYKWQISLDQKLVSSLLNSPNTNDQSNMLQETDNGRNFPCNSETSKNRPSNDAYSSLSDSEVSNVFTTKCRKAKMRRVPNNKRFYFRKKNPHNEEIVSEDMDRREPHFIDEGDSSERQQERMQSYTDMSSVVSNEESEMAYGLSSNDRYLLLNNLSDFQNLAASPNHEDKIEDTIAQSYLHTSSIPTTYSSSIHQFINPITCPSSFKFVQTKYFDVKPVNFVSFLNIDVLNSASGSTEQTSPSRLSQSSKSQDERYMTSGRSSSCERSGSSFSDYSRIGDSPTFNRKKTDGQRDQICKDQDPDVFIGNDNGMSLDSNHIETMKFEKDELDDSDDSEIMECTAEGLGLSQGLVGTKNNFQVWVGSSKNGSLSVTIHGPRPHTVTETNVVYTGDNLYEVLFEVSHPGYYVICIKWAGKEIQDSPYLCRVTY